ncbi:MAG: zinc-ribbon domain containing protein [Terracidiphilus sp.]
MPAAVPSHKLSFRSVMRWGCRLMKCVDCSGEFVFTAGEQLFCSKEFENDPKHCKRNRRQQTHRAHNRQALNPLASMSHSDAAGFRIDVATGCSPSCNNTRNRRKHRTRPAGRQGATLQPDECASRRRGMF